ncbi:uncharacterized protein PV09_01882 [Verruconis gallopava]|uniref:DNA repair metallo-beta-lactamase domain-containing protein n=1 Tax=Verruconis gallopava TaxID=253628 RepID=A0A0D2AMP3_9PEZI|nr:uncharacterized protein PV09_01882 [Verruconis gallopava]KIW07983.1 hypothetical protein PV09_01882 [Verruconis gallopava]
MFRNPRENADLPSDFRVLPSTGRPPTPPRLHPPRRKSNIPAPMPAKAPAAKTKQTKLNAVNIMPTKPKAAPNGNILSFFKKAEELADNLFVKDRYNEFGGPDKRRRTTDLGDGAQELGGSAERDVRTVPESADLKALEVAGEEQVDTPVVHQPKNQALKRRGPFMDESDSEDDEPASSQGAGGGHSSNRGHDNAYNRMPVSAVISRRSMFGEPGNESENEEDLYAAPDRQDQVASMSVPQLKKEETTYNELGDIEGFEDINDFDDEEFPSDGEEALERRYMAEHIKLQMSDDTYADGLDSNTLGHILGPEITSAEMAQGASETARCPICSIEMKGVSEEQASVHVNSCLDGNPTPLPGPQATSEKNEPMFPELVPRKPPFKMRQPKPGQNNPIMLTSTINAPTSAFAKLMSGHAEDTAWKIAAASEKEARGKQAFERTCPFYKIMPDMNICVDAFRYGAVEGCKGYFLSHFHSDHYIGLTSSWRHGPIYCSRVTGNLVRQQLKVDPKYVVDLEFEEEREIPDTPGVRVTMIPANHCPGSSLFLFEKPLGKGPNSKKKRILHCGDFRACREHIEHPLLRPDVQCHITGKSKEQKIDVCYLDTTYLNPKFAFPSQESVIRACADMCVSLNKASVDDTDEWETMKRQRANAGMVQFLESGKESVKQEAAELVVDGDKNQRGRLLVVVGTYSIGKERICMGIAKALNSKIFASAGKQRICAALEDPELMERLTSDPREAQVHMTPLFEIRADTLDEYLKDFRDTFSRAVAFRPSGWNYRPPNSRFTESPSVQTVLYSSNWKSNYSMRELKPQPGSTNRATCYGVPYSEHSSFRELTMFCCALRIEKIVPTVNVGSAKSRERMKGWIERWGQDRRKNGLFQAKDFH